MQILQTYFKSEDPFDGLRLGFFGSSWPSKFLCHTEVGTSPFLALATCSEKALAQGYHGVAMYKARSMHCNRSLSLAQCFAKLKIDVLQFAPAKLSAGASTFVFVAGYKGVAPIFWNE